MTESAAADALLAEIDAAHLRMREAFRRRDLPAYVACLSPDLAYYEPTGHRRTREQLAGDIGRQLSRLIAFDSEFTRATASVTTSRVTEAGTQLAHIRLRWFGILAIRWRVERQGEYTWIRAAAGWQLHEARVLKETIAREGIGLSSGA